VDGFVEHLYLDPLNDPALYRSTFGVHGPYLYERGAWTNLSGIDQGTQDNCVELRTRAANGTYSEPIVLCGKDAPHYRLTGSPDLTCTADGLAQDGKLVTGSAASCSFTSGQSGVTPFWLTLAAVLALRRRRR
jgi:MYXO-CTERM domain-containing protein